MTTQYREPRNTRKDSVRKKDAKRTPLSGPRNILTAYNIPKDYEPRWINDVDARIYQATLAGYVFVSEEGTVVGDQTVDSSGMRTGVISRPVGGGITAYLMAVPKEIYDEVQQAKAEDIDERERQWKNYNKRPGHYGETEEETVFE
jgi:hypothetical protein